MARTHTDREYEKELTELRRRLLLMAGRVETMIGDGFRAFLERDTALAEATIRADAKVNRDEMETDEICLRILARRQPVASDLRFVTLALKMVTDLERIADLAVNICERAKDLNAAPPLGSFRDLPEMAEIVKTMVGDAVDALVSGDAEEAHEVVARDDEVDELYHRTFREVLSVMLADPSAVERGIHIQSVAKFLERMADHSTNLAEQVVFMVAGRDIRHVGKLDAR